MSGSGLFIALSFLYCRWQRQALWNRCSSVALQRIGASSFLPFLIDETTVDKEIYEYLVMNFRDNISTLETVNVIVQDEIMSVNGYKNEIIPVGSIYENSIGI